MPTFWNAGARRDLVTRLDRLNPAATAAWGKFTAPGMVAHLNDSARMAMGELAVQPRWYPIRYTPLRQLLIFVLPMPRSAPTAPEIIARCGGADLACERDALKANMDKIAAGAALVPHPAFGPLSHAEWGALIWKHTDHHLRQFGV